MIKFIWKITLKRNFDSFHTQKGNFVSFYTRSPLHMYLVLYFLHRLYIYIWFAGIELLAWATVNLLQIYGSKTDLHVFWTKQKPGKMWFWSFFIFRNKKRVFKNKENIIKTPLKLVKQGSYILLLNAFEGGAHRFTMESSVDC